MSEGNSKLGFQATWSMAVGGMVGGGIFSTLGVVIGIAGQWAWLSFLIAGMVALASGYSYSKLADKYGEGGGAFTFLRKIHKDGFAGSLSWVLILGYILTNSVYAYTFGTYLAHVFDLGAWFPRAAALSILGLFVGLNLRGVGESSMTEIFLVWFKLIVLIGLACFGLFKWSPDQLSAGIPDAGISAAIFGAAAVFMAYEGFQLLAYDYDEIDNPKKTLPRALISAILVVIVIYIIVALGVAMLIGADKVVANDEVALAIAGKQALGTTGLIIVTIAAAFSTGSAINSTLFATARLGKTVADHDELPKSFAHVNSSGIPNRAIIGLGSVSAIFAIFGNLSSLVEAASLTFLFTFTTVNFLAWKAKAGHRFMTASGAIMAAAATIALTIRLAKEQPWSLAAIIATILIAVFLRPYILRKSNESP
jgi:amino acid transporter